MLKRSLLIVPGLLLLSFERLRPSWKRRESIYQHVTYQHYPYHPAYPTGWGA